MGWLRLYITTEGQSERKFADDVLRRRSCSGGNRSAGVAGQVSAFQ
jgi:hypothetical protein